MMPPNSHNGKVTIAKLEQKLEDHCIQQDKDFAEIKSDIKDIKTNISDMKDILTKGDGKIKRNFKMIDSHICNHRWWLTTMIAASTVIVAFMGLVLANQ